MITRSWAKRRSLCISPCERMLHATPVTVVPSVHVAGRSTHLDFCIHSLIEGNQSLGAD